jgi:hypothetical protein
MGSLSDYICNSLLDHVFNGVFYTPPADIYVALSTQDPLDDASGLTEPTGAEYDRQLITFGSPSAHRITQDQIVVYQQALSGAWGTMTHYALMDAQTGGQMLAYGSFASPPNVDQYKTLSIPAGEIYIDITQEISDYLANQLLDLVFNGVAYSNPDIYAALTNASVSETDTGNDLSELGMTDYARLNFNDWTTPSNGSLTNNSDMDFGVLTGTSEVLEAVALTDSSGTNTGNVLIYDNDPSVTIDVGDKVMISAGNYTISLV